MKSNDSGCEPPASPAHRGRRRAAAIATLGLAFVLAFVAMGIRSLAADSGLDDPLIGQRLSRIELQLLRDTRPPQPIQLPVKGTRTLLHFWSPHCQPCARMSATINELATRASKTPARSVFVVTDEALEDVRAHQSTQVEDHAILWDPRGRIHGQLKVDSLPTDIIVDHEGVVVRVWRRPPSKSQLQAALDAR